MVNTNVMNSLEGERELGTMEEHNINSLPHNELKTVSSNSPKKTSLATNSGTIIKKGDDGPEINNAVLN